MNSLDLTTIFNELNNTRNINYIHAHTVTKSTMLDIKCSPSNNCWNKTIYQNSINGTFYYEDYTYVDQDISFWQIPQLIILVTLFVFIVFGNTCVLIAIGLSKTGRKTRMNFFIMNLSIADLAVGLFHITVDIAEKCLVVWIGGPALCKIIRFLQVLVVYASTFMIVSLSIDRVDAIARPMKFTRKAMTVRALVYAAWVTSALLSIPSLLLNDTVELNGQSFCIMTLNKRWHWQVYITLIALTAFIIPALIIIVCYSIIIFVIWKKGRGFSNTFHSAVYRSQAFEPESPGPGQVRQHIDRGNKGIIPQAKIRTFKMTLIIVGVFVMSWCPYFVFNLMDVYEQPTEKSMTQYAVTSLIQSLAPLNSAANPIIYGCFSTRICNNLRRIPCVAYVSDWLCRCRLKRQMSVSGNNASNTEQTMVDGTSAKSLFFRRHRPNNEHETSNLITAQGKNNSSKKKKICSDKNINNLNDKDRDNLPKNAELRDKKGFYHRRPSGLPLVNRKMTPQETIILETYRQNSVKFQDCHSNKPALKHVTYKNGTKGNESLEHQIIRDIDEIHSRLKENDIIEKTQFV